MTLRMAKRLREKENLFHMRIGLLFEFGTLNGGENSMLAAIDHCGHHRVAFTAFAPQNSPLFQQLVSRGIAVENLVLHNGDGQRVSASFLRQQLSSLIEKHQLDLVHANSLTTGRHLGVIAPQLPVPTSAHLRDLMKLSKSSIQDLNQHQVLFAVSEATHDFHVAQGLDASKVFTLYNGIDCRELSPRPKNGFLHRQLNLSDDVQLAGTIGQICLRKAHNDLASAAVLLKDRCPLLHYVIVGERHSSKQESIDFDQAMTTTFEDAGMHNRLHRLGFREDVSNILNELEVLVHPARQEPLGRVLLEASASGVPIVATDVGGTSEILTNGKSALLVPPAQPEQLADAIERIQSSPTLREQFSRNARDNVCQKFNIEQRAEAILTAWEHALGNSA